MKIKSLIAATALAVSSVGALAADKDLGVLNVGETFLAGSALSTIGVLQGSFSDVFNFSIGETFGVGADVSALNLSLFDIPYYKITSLKFKLFDKGTDLSSTNDDFMVGSGNSAAGFTLSALNTGNYYLNVSGNATGALGGMYNGVISVTAVPEPETFAMMLAGLGLMGSIARRRNRKNNV